MEKLWKRMLGTAEAERLLESCRERGIPLWNIRPEDGCTLRLSLWQRDLETLRRTAESLGGGMTVLHLRGGRKDRALLRRRKPLLLALVLAAALLLASSLFVWRVEVRGCRRVSSGRVLSASR